MDRRPRVLLLGDSIRLSYQPFVAAALGEVAEVVGPSANGQYALNTNMHLAQWLGELGRPAIVHWNNGLWDVGHFPFRAPEQTPLDAYVGNLAFILRALRQTQATIIWATTTPVHRARPFLTDGSPYWSLDNSEIDLYNTAARALMDSEGIAIDDLHAVVSADPEAYFAVDQLHLSPVGIEACASAVADSVRLALAGSTAE